LEEHTVNLDAMNKSEMIEAAAAMEPPVELPKNVTKAEVRRELDARLTADRQKLEAEGEKAKAEAPPKVQGQPLTTEQREMLRKASTEKIEGILGDPKLTEAWRAEFQLELDQRRARERAAKQAASMQSPINRYRITKGGPFVVGGRITQLREGGVISDKTHRLDEVRRQGIEIEKLRGKVVVTEGRLGVPTTKIIDEPAAAPVPTGEVPT
jgi:hypothetical protein